MCYCGLMFSRILSQELDISAITQNFDFEFLVIEVQLLRQRVVDNGAIGRAWSETFSGTVSPWRRRQAIRQGRIVEMCYCGLMFSRILSQRCNIINHPKRSPLRSQHQVVAANHQVRNRDDRQVRLQCLPVLAAIERDIESALHAGEQQISSLRILPYDPGEMTLRETVGNLRPAASVVGRLVNVGSVVSFLVFHRNDISDRRIVWRHVDRIDQTATDAARRYISPVRSTVPRDMQQAII